MNRNEKLVLVIGIAVLTLAAVIWALSRVFRIANVVTGN